ncbi:uncharacterized protein M421DRAFT_8721 [Didymella exigua CBS 183.55]|uniref:Uncharacterized protein n=1 Tax=Didymella exigua CBS 183.55 TaxID=1150837 RepID=A0A6A5R880_9PLEO|nr:uncharacterized protein M421DRAFT_8721 [Didymella exigua CBS 183.55]KAF1924411.1 hypothetical protein M421DRAFT_8721 [Didymella exigua CBS 183.55]
MTKLRNSNKLYNEKIAQERRERQAWEKEERERVRAEKAEEAAERKAQRERDEQARDAQKAVQLPQRGNCKASQIGPNPFPNLFICGLAAATTITLNVLHKHAGHPSVPVTFAKTTPTL